MLRSWISLEKVHAIHLRDLEKNLQDLGLLERLQDGSIKCYNCDSTILLEDIQCLFMEIDEIRFCCSRTDCFEKVLELKGG